jgi:hypothetical protein
LRRREKKNKEARGREEESSEAKGKRGRERRTEYDKLE